MKKLLAIFIVLLIAPLSAHAASTTFYKMGGSGTIENGMLAHNGAPCSGNACSSTTACCVAGVSGTSIGTANVAITPFSGNSMNASSVCLLERYGSICQWVPLYMPGTRTIPMPPGTPSGGTAPLSGVSAVPQQLGIWCNNVAYGNVAIGMCFPGGQQAKVTGQFSGGVYAAWSCNGGFYAPPLPSNALITDHDSCVPVEAGWYSPFRELDRYPCPLNNYCPGALVGCPTLTANIANSMIPNKPNCKTVSSATTGTAAAPNFQPTACPDVENCAAAPIACPAPWTVSDGLKSAITDCYYRYDGGCPLEPNAATMEGRIYNPNCSGGGSGCQAIECKIATCLSGYSLIDGMCVMGCDAGKYFDGNTCQDCLAGKYCPGGHFPMDDCPGSHPNSLPLNPSQSLCYANCALSQNAATMSGYFYFGMPSTCAAATCVSGFHVENGRCIVNCSAGQYTLDGLSCSQCPAGYWCPANDPDNPHPCREGRFCPAGSSSETECPLTHPNSLPLSSANTQCFLPGACSTSTVPNSTAVMGMVFFGGGSTCVATACVSGYELIAGACVIGTTVLTLDKAGGSGNILNVIGTISATLLCNQDQCTLPALGVLSRAYSTYEYDTSGTNFPNGRWCTQPNGGGTCYTAGQTHTISSSGTLYAMWSCIGGYYTAGGTTSCSLAGNGYYSPPYNPNRTICPAGTYCPNAAMSMPLDCPVSHPDSDPGNTSQMLCRRPCTSVPGILTDDGTGFDYFGIANTCVATSCDNDFNLVSGMCVPDPNACPAGYFYANSACVLCTPGHYCEGAAAPEADCPNTHPWSIAGNPSEDTCYATCSLIDGATMMSGRDYYQEESSCVAMGCENNYILQDGVCYLSQCQVGMFLNTSLLMPFCDTCGAGQWYDEIVNGNVCSPVGSNYYSPALDSRRYPCPANTKSAGDGSNAASITHCAAYKTLKVNDGTTVTSVMVRATALPPTTPALRIYDGTNLYYGNLSLTPAPSGKEIKMNDGTNIYYVKDSLLAP
ncbi:MAG: hypothetical protein FWE50_00045 [Alphaproteobacteria bacterium]|nr:hypothetical protein [Alphaproteobacteria bacterium]